MLSIYCYIFPKRLARSKCFFDGRAQRFVTKKERTDFFRHWFKEFIVFSLFLLSFKLTILTYHRLAWLLERFDWFNFLGVPNENVIVKSTSGNKFQLGNISDTVDGIVMGFAGIASNYVSIVVLWNLLKSLTISHTRHEGCRSIVS